MTLSETYWRTLDHTRHFIIPDDEPRTPGELTLASITGHEVTVDAGWAARFEVSEAEARQWAQEEFGFVLDHLRHRIDAKLAKTRAAIDTARSAPVSPASPISPDAVPAMWELARHFPRALVDALSGDPARVARAGELLEESQQRLGKAGVDVAPQLGGFADRLAQLRRDFTAARGKRPG